MPDLFMIADNQDSDRFFIFHEPRSRYSCSKSSHNPKRQHILQFQHNTPAKRLPWDS